MKNASYFIEYLQIASILISGGLQFKFSGNEITTMNKMKNPTATAMPSISKLMAPTLKSGRFIP